MSEKNSRVKSIELMKALAIIWMVLIHSVEPTFLMIAYNLGLEDYTQVPGYFLAATIERGGGVISAGAFIFAMGWGAYYKESATSRSFVMRGIKLYLLGLFVNLFSGYYVRILDPEYFEIDSIKNNLFILFKTDIFLFAAVCMLFFALLKKFKTTYSRAIASIVTVLFSFCILIYFPQGTLTTGNEWFNTIVLGLLTRQNGYSYFPFASWSIFPIVGYWMAYFYKKTDNKKKLYTYTAIAAAILVAVGLSVIIAKGLDPAAVDPMKCNDDTYYGMNLWNVICGAGVVLFGYLAATLVTKLTNDRLPNFMMTMSKNISYIYVIQWIIISFLYTILIRVPSVYISFVIALGVLVATYWLAILVKRLVNGFRKDKRKD